MIKSIVFAITLLFTSQLLALTIPEKCLPYGIKGLVSSSSNGVSHYEPMFSSCALASKNDIFVVRSFDLNGKASYLTVDPKSLQSYIVSSDCLSKCEAMKEKTYLDSNYGNIQKDAVSAPFPTENDGLTTGQSGDKKLAVTIDMCPSSKGISQNVYDKLVAVAETEGKSFPVGIAMTRKWMQKYKTHFEWLKEQALNDTFEILWINHSATHPYNPKLANDKNFLLSPGVDFDDEVLGTEKALIAAGVTPSVFFRFPGLVSSQDLIEQLANWGLIPLGSKAWLAKGEKAKKDAIILIHGNKNEPAGEKLFLNYVETKTSDLAWASLLNLLGI